MARRRSGKTVLTVIGVIVVVLCLGCVSGLALVVLRVKYEGDNMVRCKNNLRQLALGNLNHHDQRGDNLPMGIFSGGVSWTGMMLPYTDQINTWRRLRIDKPYDDSQNAGVLGGSEAAIPYLYCPARRSPPRFTDGFVSGDYAMPSVGANPVDNATSLL
ncbi:MAG: DUF1559 domain-containing protein [Pirellulaceae bacterium]